MRATRVRPCAPRRTRHAPMSARATTSASRAKNGGPRGRAVVSTARAMLRRRSHPRVRHRRTLMGEATELLEKMEEAGHGGHGHDGEGHGKPGPGKQIGITMAILGVMLAF